MYRLKKRFDGELLCIYGIIYGSTRFFVEYYREADIQIGYLFNIELTLEQVLSMPMILISMGLYI